MLWMIYMDHEIVSLHMFAKQEHEADGKSQPQVNRAEKWILYSAPGLSRDAEVNNCISNSGQTPNDRRSILRGQNIYIFVDLTNFQPFIHLSLEILTEANRIKKFLVVNQNIKNIYNHHNP